MFRRVEPSMVESPSSSKRYFPPRRSASSFEMISPHYSIRNVPFGMSAVAKRPRPETPRRTARRVCGARGFGRLMTET
jgi:hypothetical protein